MTGVTFEASAETYGKRLQLLKDLQPGLRRVAVLRAAGDANVGPAMTSLARLAPQLGIQLQSFDVRSAADLERVFATMKSNRTQEVVVVAGAFTYLNRQRIVDLALKHHLPSSLPFKEAVAVGGLVSLGPDLVEMARQGAAYVTKIIEGSNPGDLPVEQLNAVRRLIGHALKMHVSGYSFSSDEVALLTEMDGLALQLAGRVRLRQDHSR
jgi:putative tryptophan/tyrosine transport system substrate-binding protein